MLLQLTLRQISFFGALLSLSFILLSQSVGAEGGQARVQAARTKSVAPLLPGTHYQEMMRLAKAKGYSVKVVKNMTVPELKTLIDGGKPVICLIQAWAEKTIDYSNDWEDGHYVLAIGHDQGNIFFMDPSTLCNYTYIPTDEFVKRWHDTDGKEKLVHFGLIIEKSKPKYNPAAFIKLN